MTFTGEHHYWGQKHRLQLIHSCLGGVILNLSRLQVSPGECWSLTLLSLFGLDELGPHVGSHNVGAPQVSHPEHQTQLVISQGDNGVFGEDQGLRPLVGLRNLHKHASNLEKGHGRHVGQRLT